MEEVMSIFFQVVQVALVAIAILASLDSNEVFIADYM